MGPSTDSGGERKKRKRKGNDLHAVRSRTNAESRERIEFVIAHGQAVAVDPRSSNVCDRQTSMTLSEFRSVPCSINTEMRGGIGKEMELTEKSYRGEEPLCVTVTAHSWLRS